MNKNALGVFCKNDKNFYYLESGDNHVTNTVPRITKTLYARGLIELSGDNPYTYSEYEIMKISDAVSKDLELNPIFINDHVKTTYENKKEVEISSKWK